MTLPILEIRLSAIVENWRKIRNHRQTTTGAVLKANAYGIGALKVAPPLYQEGCRHFFVHCIEEARLLRGALQDPQAIIYTLSGCPQKTLIPKFKKHAITPILCTENQVLQWDRALPYALHFDTGINRLGIDYTQASSFKDLQPTAVISHLSCSGTLDHPKNKHQADCFQALITAFPTAIKSFLNTAGSLNTSLPAFDLIRPGSGLYGINSTEDPFYDTYFKPTLALKVPVLQVRNFDVPVSCGYDLIYKTLPPAQFTTLSFGYANGFFRICQKNGAYAFFKGYPLPFAGRISMDMIILDTSNLPVSIQEGDWVELLNDELTVNTIARWGETIPAEIVAHLATSSGKKKYL